MNEDLDNMPMTKAFSDICSKLIENIKALENKLNSLEDVNDQLTKKYADLSNQVESFKKSLEEVQKELNRIDQVEFFKKSLEEVHKELDRLNRLDFPQS